MAVIGQLLPPTLTVTSCKDGSNWPRDWMPWLGIQKKMDKFAIVGLILDDKAQLVGDCTEDGNNKQTINSETCDLHLASAKFTETNFTF